MRKYVILVLLNLGMSSLFAQVSVIKMDDLTKEMSSSTKSLKVFNFWATWCGPCVKELPHFEKANQKEDVQVYLVSLDFVQDLDRVEKFSSKKKLKSKIYLLNEKDYDSYMSKISESWSGAIPATLMIDQDGNRHFYEKAFAENELNMEIDKRMN